MIHIVVKVISKWFSLAHSISLLQDSNSRISLLPRRREQLTKGVCRQGDASVFVFPQKFSITSARPPQEMLGGTHSAGGAGGMGSSRVQLDLGGPGILRLASRFYRPFNTASPHRPNPSHSLRVSVSRMYAHCDRQEVLLAAPVVDTAALGCGLQTLLAININGMPMAVLFSSR